MDPYEKYSYEILLQETADNIAIYAGSVDSEPFVQKAKELIDHFRTVEGEIPESYSELEAWVRYMKPEGWAL